MVGATKSLLGVSASLLALATAMPVSAQDTSQKDPSTTVTPDQIQGEVGKAQERSGAGNSSEIIVTGIRASIQASLNEKKKSDMVSEVITAQDIGKFPDKNVADSLGRLTGVNTVTGSASGGGFGENQNVSIRGTDPALNLTLLDGHSVATGDWFVLDQTSGGRSFNFSMFPSEIVGSLEVYKSAEADIVEGGVGGTINVHSRMPLDFPSGTFSVTGQGVYNDLAAKSEPQFSGVASWHNQDSTFGVLASGFYEKRAFRRDGQEFLGYAPATNFGGSGQTVLYPTLIGNAYFTQQRIRKGGSLAVQFKPSDTLEITATGLYTRMDANNTNVNSMAWVSNLVGKNSTPGSTANTLQPGWSTIKGSDGNTYLSSASWGGTAADGSAVNGKIQDDIFRTAYSSTWVANLNAKWKPVDPLTLTGEVGYTKGKGATTDTEAWETFWHTGMSYAFDGKHADLNFPNLPTDTTSAAYLNNFYNWSWGGKIVSPDKEFYAKADAEYAVDNGWLKSLKIGGRYTDHKRILDYTAYSWAGNGIYSGSDTIGLGTVFGGTSTPDDYSDDVAGAAPYPISDRDKVLQELSTNGGRVFGFYPPSSFSVHEKTQAVYAMAKVGNDRDWRGNIGVRAVHTDLTSTQYTTDTSATPEYQTPFGNFMGVNTKNKYWDILPSANLTYNLKPDLLLRAAAAKVMARPGYAQLAGAFSLNTANNTGTAGGNPNLKPYRAWQFNVAAEWYYAPQALFSVGAFDLDIKSYITSQTFEGTYYNVTTKQYETFRLTGPANGGGGTNKGFEVNWQQPLKWGFGLIANYTYSDAKKKKSALTAADNYSRVIDGNSKHTYNITGYFENSLLSARLAYSFRSKFRVGVDRATPKWQADFGQLDGSVLFHLTPHIALSFDAQNILNHKLYYYVSDPSIPYAIYNNGRTVYAGARVTF
ncbi:TonB-dependent receptor [Sphingomonas oryzagri]